MAMLIVKSKMDDAKTMETIDEPDEQIEALKAQPSTSEMPINSCDITGEIALTE